MRKCANKNCRKPSRDRLCSACYSRQMRERNPMYHCYLNLKHNSKRRGIPFELTFEQFKVFAIEVNYLGLKGKTRDSWSIDRIDPREGYHIFNIQLLKHPDNCSKGKKILVYDWRSRTATVLKVFEKLQSERGEDMPF